MDLISMMERVPPLLEACVEHASPDVWRKWRLINKEASRVALLAMKSYSLTLQDTFRDTTIPRAKILKQTHLRHLNVHLCISDSYSPAIPLMEFLLEYGPVLGTVTSLALRLEDDDGDSVATTVLDDVLSALLRCCPVLQCVSSRARLSRTFLRSLARVCPLLTRMDFTNGNEDLHHLQTRLQLLPSLLPRVNSLELPLYRNHHYGTHKLPDMSSIIGIRFLHLDLCVLASDHDWLCLPPRLELLKCASFTSAPPTSTTGGLLLHSLLSLLVASSVPLGLDCLALLLKSAPNLRTISDGSWLGAQFSIDCSPNFPLIAADLLTLTERTDIDTIRNAVYCINGSMANMETYRPFLAFLPCMAGVRKCKIENLASADLSLVLGIFPDVQLLTLSSINGMGDVGLQSLAGCTKLTSLSLKSCEKVSPTGLFALCTRLPGLRSIFYSDCALLSLSTLSTFQQLLQRDISLKQTL